MHRKCIINVISKNFDRLALDVVCEVIFGYRMIYNMGMKIKIYYSGWVFESNG